MASASGAFNISSMIWGVIGGMLMCGFVHNSVFAMSVGNLMEPIASMVDSALGMGGAGAMEAAAVTAGGALVLEM